MCRTLPLPASLRSPSRHRMSSSKVSFPQWGSARVLLSIVALYQREGLLATLQHVVQLKSAYCQAGSIFECCLSQQMGDQAWRWLCAGDEYKATKDLWLCPQSRLLADSPEGSEFVYNGQGHSLILPEGLHEGEALPVIIVGIGKSLQLKDVKLVHAASLPACIQLGSGKC